MQALLQQHTGAPTVKGLHAGRGQPQHAARRSRWATLERCNHMHARLDHAVRLEGHATSKASPCSTPARSPHGPCAHR